MADPTPPLGPPLIQPLGDSGLIVRFAPTLSDAANRATIAFAQRLRRELPAGVSEIDPNLVSVLLKYDPTKVRYEQLAGDVRLLLAQAGEAPAVGREQVVPVTFGGDAGPDLEEVAASLELAPADFIAAHCAKPLRVLAVGFAPGFLYCGFHSLRLHLPRRAKVRTSVPAGTVLFAAGQTAITSTAIPTGWHVVGRTAFRNFDAEADPPTVLREGDEVIFEVAS